MQAALYLSIWVALVLFVAGEVGRSGGDQSSRWRRWAWWSSAAGLALAALHFVLAFELRHAWSHASALRETARQTAAVYGLDFGAGVYVNYAFLAVWAIDLWRWRPAARPRATRARLGVWIARAFYLVVIINAAVIFAGGMRRVLGVLVVTGLIVAWARPTNPREHLY